ncbi:acyltransferase [Psychromicrobium lacuslunae]|uniref:Acyltransferase n=1 Tax=Psychromicrobium lacuslunae TaxID=1618207 RepID=A0A0D4C3V6_9MICC|nr:acyltransferase [Psychromicrobium lacuslunae]
MPAGRDLVVDFIRVLCMFAVVAVHLLMIGIRLDSAGVQVVNPIASISWFAQGSWFGQVMPLFFVVGGFASLTSWRSLQRRGGDAADYLRGRLLRLIRPTAALYAFLAIALWIAHFAGAPQDLLAAVAIGAGVQLWFLAAYLLCQLMVPVMAKLHQLAPWRTIGALLAGAIIVDALRLASHQDVIGLANLFFVWLLVQQIGFCYADGAFDQLSRWQLVAIAASCYLIMIPLTHGGPYPVDMLTALNPPMLPLVLIGLAQICLVKACYPALSWLTRQKPVQQVMFLVGTRSITIYLWHLPLIIALFGLSLMIGLPFPEPGNADWWLSRPLYYLAAFGLVLLVTKPLVRLESASTALAAGHRKPTLWLVVLATVVASTGPFAVMRVGLDLNNVLWGFGALCLALLLVRGRKTVAFERR